MAAAGAQLLGTFNDALLKREDGGSGPQPGAIIIENFALTNYGATGKGIECHEIFSARIQTCRISAFIGIETYNAQSVTVMACTMSGSSKTGIGILAGNATTIIGCDFAGMGNGRQAPECRADHSWRSFRG